MRLLAATIALATMAVVAACDSREGIPVGDAIPERKGNYGSGTHLPPNHEIINAITGFTNGPQDVELVDIRPVEIQGEESGELVRVVVGPGPLGAWLHTYPLIDTSTGTCEVRKMSPPEGYKLQANDDLWYGFWVRSKAPGTFRIKSFDVIYRYDGGTYRYREPFTLELFVAKKHPWQVPADERRCAHLSDWLPNARPTKR